MILIDPNKKKKGDQEPPKTWTIDSKNVLMGSGLIKFFDDKKVLDSFLPYTGIVFCNKGAFENGDKIIMIRVLYTPYIPMIQIVYKTEDARNTAFNIIMKWWGN